jgi:hypothetical protein
VIAADDLPGAAIVLAEDRVQQRLARPRVAHVEGVARLDHRAAHEVLVDQRGDRARAHVGRNVAGLEVAEQRMDEHAVAVSIATFARYSCERCIGLRVWNAATRDQPSRSNSARVCAAS